MNFTRNILRKALVATGRSLGVLAISVSLLASAVAAKKPNIVLFLADDLGWADVGFHGSEIRTPHIDALAERGVVLDQFYVQPTCTPTRIALMTGRYPFRCGGQVCVLRPYHKHGVPLDERFLSQALQQAGYKTSITGKWHLGLARRTYWPSSRGFDLQYGCLGGAIDYFTHEGYGVLDWNDNENVPLREEGYSTDLIGARAAEVVRNHRFDEQPLFLYVPFNAPHTPRQAKEEDLAEYASIRNGRRRTHAAMVTAMDRQIGAVLSAIEQRKETRNTLVIFASDNGGYAGAADNKPLRGNKGTLYEGGVRVPACVVWPQGLEGGRSVTERIHIVDLFPTLVTLANGVIDSGKQLDGINVWPAIANGKQLPERDVIHNVFDASGRGAIRRGDWKLIVQPQRVLVEGVVLGQAGLRAQLFNINEDPYEKQDLAASHPELVSQLWETLKRHGSQAGDSGPYCEKAPTDWKAPADWSQVPD
jgi:arylsulfatase A-like enzyme